jgi:enoyl-CoA hydratase
MEHINYDVDKEGLATITLNRPEKLNALNEQVLRGLAELFEQAKSDKRVKGLILTGNGKAFCAGADIKRLAECDAQLGYQFAQQGQSVFRALETMGKPSIAAINGYAFGGGCELAISASIRIASFDAQFGQPEVKLGVIPGYGGTQRLARLVGKGRAMDLCLSGRFIRAEEALSWGLVSDVVEAGQLLPHAKDRLRQITQMAPLAIQSVLEVVDRGFDMALDDALHLEAVHFAKTCATADKQEGVSAFLEKRAAEFKGE